MINLECRDTRSSRTIREVFIFRKKKEARKTYTKGYTHKYHHRAVDSIIFLFFCRF